MKSPNMDFFYTIYKIFIITDSLMYNPHLPYAEKERFYIPMHLLCLRVKDLRLRQLFELLK